MPATIPRYQSAPYGPYGSTTQPGVAAPTNLRSTGKTSSTITLAWSGPAGTQTLERAPVTNNVVGSFAPVYTGPDKGYQDMGLTYVTTYAYRVKVTVNGVDSPYSNVVQVTTAASATQPIAVAVDTQRAATLSNIPAGSAATDYEYQFRPGPTVSGQRQVDMSQTLAAGENATDYEYQSR